MPTILVSLVATSVIAMTACGSSTPAPAAATVPAPERAAISDDPSAPQTFAEITLFEGDETEPGLRVHGNGTVETRSVHYESASSPGVSTWKTIAAIAPDDSFTVLGKAGGKLEADGAVVLADGQRSDVTIVDDKVTVGPYWMALDATGAVSAAKPPKRAMRVEGAADAQLRRRALLAMSIAFAWPFEPVK